MKKASIIVTVDTEYPLISNFFQLLFQSHDMSEYELIVVDDHCSHHETVEYLRHLSQKKQIDQFILLGISQNLLPWLDNGDLGQFCLSKKLFSRV